MIAFLFGVVWLLMVGVQRAALLFLIGVELLKLKSVRSIPTIKLRFALLISAAVFGRGHSFCAWDLGGSSKNPVLLRRVYTP